MNRNTLCNDCNHALSFHINLDGQPRPCDHETVTPYGLGEQPALCGCRRFQYEVPVANEHAGECAL